MGSDITLSSAVRSNLLSLQNTADLLAKTQEKLATGKGVHYHLVLLKESVNKSS